LDWMEFYDKLCEKVEPFSDDELTEELRRETFRHTFLRKLWDSILCCIEEKKWLEGAILGFSLFEWAYRMGKYERLEKPKRKLDDVMRKESMPDIYQSFLNEIRVLRNKFFHLEFDKLTPKGDMGRIFIKYGDEVFSRPTDDRFLTLCAGADKLCIAVAFACKVVCERYFASFSTTLGELLDRQTRLILTAFKNLIQWKEMTGFEVK